MTEANPQAGAQAQPSTPITPEAAQAALSAPVRVEVVPGTNNQQATPTEPKNRPEWLPQKFKWTGNVEEAMREVSRSYGELEKRLGGKPTEAPKPADGKPAEVKKDDLSIEAAEKQAEEKGIDLAAYQTEFESAGKLSDKSYESLASKGIPKDVVDAYIAGRQALAERTVDEMTKDVGGREGYQKIAQWAMQNVPKDELEAYNKIVTGTDQAAAKIALAGLHARFKSAQEPSFFRAGEQPNSQGDVFRSTDQITKAINDPRYKSDPAYRQEVEQKIMRSNVI